MKSGRVLSVLVIVLAVLWFAVAVATPVQAAGKPVPRVLNSKLCSTGSSWAFCRVQWRPSAWELGGWR